MGRDARSELLPGTLELLILRTLTAREMHGYGIAQRVKTRSGEVLEVGESSLYPALQRLLPGMTAREVSDAFARTFDPTNAVFVAQLPAGEDVPSESDLLVAGRAAVVWSAITLGLAISLSLAESLSGALTVESKAGAGSRFRLWIPRRGPEE